MIFGADSNAAQRINLIDFGHPLMFHLAAPAGQTFDLSGEISL